MAYIFDTGPLFKFLATDCVPQLISAIGGSTVVVPEAVDFEIHDTPIAAPNFDMPATCGKSFLLVSGMSSQTHLLKSSDDAATRFSASILKRCTVTRRIWAKT